MTCLLATPGRLVDHLENTKGFNLRSLKYLVCSVIKIWWSLSYTLHTICTPYLEPSFRCCPAQLHTTRLISPVRWCVLWMFSLSGALRVHLTACCLMLHFGFLVICPVQLHFLLVTVSFSRSCPGCPAVFYDSILGIFAFFNREFKLVFFIIEARLFKTKY